jgi:hypothetical protein
LGEFQFFSLLLGQASCLNLWFGFQPLSPSVLWY